ncbi:MAG: hypothetical protein GX022_01765 [Clostridiaceae bacterium]|nr:hypothetical protein [Clostridiaceae bacterium]
MENSSGMGNQKEKSNYNIRKIALTGILSAFIVIVLFLESIAPTGRLGFYVLAGFILSVIILEAGAKWAWASYVITCAAGFLVIPEKLNILPYVSFFGIYTILKYHIESLRKTWLEILLKFAAFNLFLWPAWSITKTFLPHSLTSGTMIIVAGIVSQVLFVLYDMLFTGWIRFYFEKIASIIRKS